MNRNGPSDAAATPTRRRLLQAGAVTATIGLAGCIEEMGSEFPENEQWPTAESVPSLPVAKRSEIAEERITELSGADITDPEALVAALEEYDMTVESIERERDVLALAYVNTDRHDEGNVHDVSLIAGGYAALVDAGYEAVELGATILDDAPASYGSATVETSLATEYNESALTAAEYGELVVSTIESKRYEPTVDVSEQ